MMTATSVDWALSNTALTRDPEYVNAVVRAYVQAKAANGRAKQDISYKLEWLEREYVQFAHSFLAVRQEYGLPPSRVIRLRPPPPTSAANSTAPLRRAQTSTSASTPSSSRLSAATPGINRTHTTTGATITSRPVNPEDAEPPPPPYTTQDPEPEATRMLQERLAAEAVSAASAPPIAPPPAPSTPSGAPARTPSSASTRPAQNQTRLNSSTQGPSTPSTPARNSISSRPPVDSGPEPPPSDPEMARVWEESQLVEAQRASLAAQREEAELEEAMRLSLAEAESHAESSSAADAGPSRRQMSAVFEEEEASNSRRVSSYHPLPTAQANPHRRVMSFASGALANDQPIPGEWHGSRPASGIMDQNDEVNNFGPPALTPNKTGHALRSNNPFLSATEREHLEAEEEGRQPSLDERHSALDDLAGLQIGGSSSPQQDNAAAGSSHTHYDPLGTSSSEQYAPPPGLPPTHLRMQSSPPSGSTSRPLPRAPRGGSQAAVAPPILPPRPGPNKLAEPQNDAREDPLETLKDFDTVFLVDDSTSMAGERFAQARLAIMEVAEIAARYDEDGVDVYFINSKRVGKELRAATDVEDLFSGLQPKGATPTGLRLEVILREYMARLERSVITSPGLDGQPSEQIKPMNLIVVTDGAPTDDPESVLIACAKRLDKGDFPLSQVGIQFLQIGDDSEAREALEVLDDGLSSAHGVRDMVDTVPFNGEEMSATLIIKTLLGGINRRLDRRGG